MAIGALTGITADCEFGAVTLVNFESWELTPEAVEEEYFSNETGKFPATAIGGYRWTGSVVQTFQSTAVTPALKIGASGAWKFHVDDTGSNYYSGTARILSYGAVTAVRGGGRVQRTVNIRTEGSDLTENGAVPKIFDT